MRAVASLAALVLLPMLAACGGGAAFPEPTPCAQAPSAVAGSGRQAINQYFASVRTAVDRLAMLRETLRNTYPGDKFSRESQFRVDFAAYADSTVCGAQNLVGVRAPAANFEQFDRDLDAALQGLIDHTQAGRTAVKARNVSDYRTWYQGVDLKLDAVKAAAAQAGR